jgi:hypothetical protein
MLLVKPAGMLHYLGFDGPKDSEYNRFPLAIPTYLDKPMVANSCIFGWLKHVDL